MKRLIPAAAVIAITFLNTTSAGTYNGAAGTQANPHQSATPAQHAPDSVFLTGLQDLQRFFLMG